MRFIIKIMLQFQAYINIKKKRKLCLDCNEVIVPRKEISTLNLLFFIIIGAVIYFITKSKLSFFLPIILAIINSLFTKPKCPKCKGTNLSDTKIEISHQK